MTTGSYEDAIKAFKNAYDIEPLPQALYQKARVKVFLQLYQCYIALSVMEDAYTALSYLVESGKYKNIKSIDDQKSIITDNKCLTAIRIAVKNKKGETGIYKKSITILSHLIEQEGKLNPALSLDKVEALGNKNQDSKNKIFPHNLSHKAPSKLGAGNTFSTLERTQQSVKIDGAMISEMQNDEAETESAIEEKNNRYRENIFSQEDYYLYRGVMNFYSKNYKLAMTDFEMSASLKKETKTLANPREAEEPSETASIDTDLSDVGLCSVNINENHYNIILCLILVFLETFPFRLEVKSKHQKNAH